MARLSLPIDRIKAHYTVVVVGSGYGGGIAASRLARAGKDVCVLERGKEFQPGEYPNTEPRAASEMQVDSPDCHAGPRTGLYDFRLNDDINVFIGCGLGGTSLVNANVSLRAEPRVFDDERWPEPLRHKADPLIDEGYRRAEEMLKPVPYPDTFDSLAKLEAHEKSAARLKAMLPDVPQKFYKPPINVTFQDGVNHVGVEQHACELCGDCVTGCNYGAKNTLIMNYLPDARNHGAEIFTQASVRRLEREGNRWLVHYQLLESGREKFDAPTLFVSADIVVLSAGTLGSTEILLRSKEAGLPLSGQIGARFTGNGDVLAFGYNNDSEIDGIGFGHRSPAQMRAEFGPVGPCITSVIDMSNQPNLEDGMVIEEGSIPGAIGAILPPALATASKIAGKDTDAGIPDMVEEGSRELQSLVRGPYFGAVRNTQTYLIMSHDDANGTMSLEADRLRVSWPGVGAQHSFLTANARLEEATRALGGNFVPNPTWSEEFGKKLVTVHPLGGCTMAVDAARGVVNHKNQVFSGQAGDAVYENLYVCDGAVIPRSLGLNPLLTISALAERACYLLAQDRGWNIDYALPSAPPPPAAPLPIGLQFTEKMTGFFSTEITDDYARAAERGQAANSPMAFELTIFADDLDKFLTVPEHTARMAGTLEAPALSPQPLTAIDGKFNLFIADPAHIETREMRYEMKAVSEDGATYFFEGHKVIHHDRPLDLWDDTTTLYVTVYRGDSATTTVLGKGVLKIRPDDFAKQMTTLQITNTADPVKRLEARARFGSFFAGVLFETYGGVFAKPHVFDPSAPPRKKRPLRVDAPEVHFFNTDDGVDLRLTRYRGGTKGPVVLSHGLGVSSLIFSIDTIETNLLEYLFAHGYDVWLLDFRASIDLPASNAQFTGDDIARFDYPAAVAKVRAVTGSDSVQMVVHCFGATTFFMAMLAGLQGVRSVVCSQIAAHVIAAPMTRLKTGLHVPETLHALGIESLTAYSDTHADWMNRLFNKAVALYPMQAEEHCTDPVCHRITFMYSNLYEHDQLNQATHDALHEMFGIANMKAFEQISLLCRKQHLVAADGSEIYMNHLDRLALPITFIHGAENECFLPQSTQITFETLSQLNGTHLYSRHVVPGYGHIDCIFGKDAVRDVYPLMLRHLDATQ